MAYAQSIKLTIDARLDERQPSESTKLFHHRIKEFLANLASLATIDPEGSENSAPLASPLLEPQSAPQSAPQNAPQNNSKNEIAIYVCTHYDWLEAAMLLLDSDLANPEAKAHFSPAEYRIFRFKSSVWSFSRDGVVEGRSSPYHSKQQFATSSPSLTTIRNIWAVGRNYGAHAKELSNPVPNADSEPMIFLKAGTSIVANGENIRLPKFSNDIHHECEVAFRFGPGLQFSEVTIALDLTARDVQNRLKQAQHPWTLAKSFRDSCPIGPLKPIKPGTDLQNLKFQLRVNGELRQSGSTSEMIHSVENLRQYIVENFPVEVGDLLLTGTPSGVAALKPGDQIDAELLDIVQARWQVQ
jgi:2-keto-4-pentenoate hydratase/2-oxohepta-3-ene-1,7-dioic acid hydratase in catechol pathway